MIYVILTIMAVVALVAFTAKLPKYYPPDPDCPVCKGTGVEEVGEWFDDMSKYFEACSCTKEERNTDGI